MRRPNHRWSRASTLSRLGVVAIATSACSSSAPQGFLATGPASDGGTGHGQDGGGPGFSGGDGGALSGNGDAAGAQTTDCSGDASDFVYVLTSQGGLYRFAPAKKQLTKVGDLHCGNGALSGFYAYNSMAVDRNATAWVNVMDMSGGAIYRASAKDATCESTPAVTLTQDWHKVGMGFSLDAPGGTSETLFVMTLAGTQSLGRVDMGSMSVVSIATGQGGAELTGNANALLFGFFVNQGSSSPPSIGTIDKKTAAVSSPAVMTGVAQPNDWAFSFWGGHFYLYTQSDQQSSSSVTDYDPVSGKIDTAYMTDVGISIVGAGVSTCAPTTQPPPK